MNMRASGASELRKILQLLILKRLYPVNVVVRPTSEYFVSETYIYFQVSNYISIHTYTINAVSCHYTLLKIKG